MVPMFILVPKRGSKRRRAPQQAPTPPARKRDRPDPAAHEVNARRAVPDQRGLDLIEGTNTGLERPAKGWINRFSVTENWTQTSTPPVLTTARPLETVSVETVSKQPGLNDRPLDQSPGQRAMAPIDA
jgi:hypothetical protein